MNIYFACSITGGRGDEKEYQQIVDLLLGLGHEVPTAMLASPEVTEFEGLSNEVEVYKRDTGWIRGCDLVVAEVSTPSHGVGYEIGYALGLGKPVICLHKAAVKVSKMITGNEDPKLTVLSYDEIGSALANLQELLEGMV